MSGTRKPMSEEAKARIAEGVRKSFEAKRLASGITPMNVPSGTVNGPVELLSIVPEIVKMNELVFDPALFVPMKVGNEVDALFSTLGGLTKSTNFILIGDPGVGKSTVTLDIISGLQKNGNKCLFISAEMDRTDLYLYVQRYPKFGEIDILFLPEYDEHNPKLVLEAILENGYDVVLMDSFIEIQDSIKEFNKIAGNSAEKWLVDLMKSHNMGRNKTGAYTSFLCIQQVNKDGSFVGTNKLKHNTHGMMEIRFTGDDRYMQFIKNRKGEVLKKLYYDLSTPKDVLYTYEDPTASDDDDEEDEEERDYSELGIKDSRD